jgi:hypothetical protein
MPALPATRHRPVAVRHILVDSFQPAAYYHNRVSTRPLNSTDEVQMNHSTPARQLLCVLTAALVFMSSVAAGQAKAIDFAELDKVIEDELKSGHTPGP